jgi:DNA-binding SARP family transcriptional activator
MDLQAERGRVSDSFKPGHRARKVHLRLLNGFRLLSSDRPVEVPLAAQRLLALLAVEGRTAHRLYLASQLWPEVEEARAAANLRSALWRIRTGYRSAIEASRSHLRLAPAVIVDLHVASRLARAIEEGTRFGEWVSAAWSPLSSELLPDWYDDWVIWARERFHQLRLHALEALSRTFVEEGRFGPAVEAAQLAIAGEPLRESAHRALILAYLAEGNRGAALAQFEECRRLCREELAVEPSPRLEDLVRSSGVLTGRPAAVPARRG